MKRLLTLVACVVMGLSAAGFAWYYGALRTVSSQAQSRGANVHVGIPQTVVPSSYVISSSPTITLENTTPSDANGARASSVVAKGHQSGNEESMLGKLVFSHDGTGDDEKGQILGYINDGNDGNAPTQVLVLQDGQVSIGLFAGQNAGTSSNNVGSYAGRNAGTSSNNVGNYAGQNAGDYASNVGQNAGRSAGNYASNIGYYAGENAGIFSNNVGSLAGRYAGNSSNNVGYSAGEYSTTRNNSFGQTAGRYIQGSDNIAIGDGAWDSFLTDAGSAQTFDNTDITVVDDDITITGHSFGSPDEYVNVTYTEGTSAISGLTDGAIYQVLIVDANTLSFNEKRTTITSAGTGTGHTLTPQYTYTNSICIGADVDPSASNQTTIGNASTTETILAGHTNMKGSQSSKVRTIAAATGTIAITDRIIVVDYTTTGTVALDLPAASTAWNATTNTGMQFLIKDLDCNANNNNITISRVGSDTIVDSAAAQTATVISSAGGAIWIGTIAADTWIVY